MGDRSASWAAPPISFHYFILAFHFQRCEYGLLGWKSGLCPSRIPWVVSELCHRRQRLCPIVVDFASSSWYVISWVVSLYLRNLYYWHQNLYLCWTFGESSRQLTCMSGTIIVTRIWLPSTIFKLWLVVFGLWSSEFGLRKTAVINQLVLQQPCIVGHGLCLRA